jgi:hypothetical protein
VARPRKVGLDYFPHDTNTCADEKIQLLEEKFGNDGYAAFFKLLEGAHKARAGILDLQDIEVMGLYARRCRMTPERLLEIVGYAVDRGLFDRLAWADRLVTSDRIKENLKHVTRQRIQEEIKENYTKEDNTILKKRIDRITCDQSALETMQETAQETKQEIVYYADRIYLTDFEFATLYFSADLANKNLTFLLDQIKRASDWSLAKGKRHADSAAFMRNWVKKAKAFDSRGRGYGKSNFEKNMEMIAQLEAEELQ